LACPARGDASPGEPGLVHLVRDVDAPRRALLDMAVTAAGIGTFDWDLVTGRLEWDERLLELVGATEAGFDHTVEQFHALLHPKDVVRVQQTLDRAIAGREDFATEYRVVPPDGATRWLAAHGRALSDQQAHDRRGRRPRRGGARADCRADRPAARGGPGHGAERVRGRAGARRGRAAVHRRAGRAAGPGPRPGVERLRGVLAELAGRDLDVLCDEILARMLPPDPDDDVALVAVRLHAQDPPPARVSQR
jgi:PAS domain-containing protein